MSNQSIIINNFISEWKQAVNDDNHQIIESLFNKEANFYSPIVNTPYKEKTKFFKLIYFFKSLGEDFKYTQEYKNDLDMTICLQFETIIKDPKTNKKMKVEGVDLFKLNEEGKIIELKVMLRPLKSTLIVASEMKKKLLGKSNL